MPYKTLECEQCGDDFEAWHTAKYCSDECGEIARRVYLTCEYCGDEYSKPSPSKAEGSRFCSLECHNKNQDQKVELECVRCGSSYKRTPSKAEKSRFCSLECLRSAGGEHHWRYKKETHECQYCGEEFLRLPGRGEGKYCSNECYNNSNRTTVNCDFCGQEVTKPSCRISRQKNNYCSKECADKGKQSRVLLECQVCGCEFETIQSKADRKYCSMKCRNHGIKKRVTVECENCGDCFEVRPYREEEAKYCSSACQLEGVVGWDSGSDHHLWKEGADPYYGEDWLEIRDMIRARDCHKCRNCGVEETELERELHVHHIKPLREFDSPERANNPSNLISLCATCHRELERDPKACKALL